MYRQHRQVVALLGIAHKGVDGLVHLLHHGGGTVVARNQQTLGNTPDALVAKLGVADVLGLVESVGEEENGGVPVDEDFLLRELPVGLDADGQVRVSGQHVDTATDEQGRVVTGIAVA